VGVQFHVPSRSNHPKCRSSPPLHTLPLNLNPPPTHLIAWRKLGCGSIKSSTPHPPIHTISRHRPKASIYSFSYTPTRFTIFNRYYFTALLLVITWRKLERGSNKMFARPPILSYMIQTLEILWHQRCRLLRPGFQIPCCMYRSCLSS
jgi:hypothetical protein